MQNDNGTPGTILVAMDGSLPARAAAAIAIQIAQSQNSRIHGLFVVDETIVLNSYASYKAELGVDAEPTSRSELAAWFEEEGDVALSWLETECQHANVPVTTDLLLGSVPELVLKKAAQAQLLALGRHGRGHADDPGHLGRYFRAIARHAHRPMLIGGDEMPRSIQHLLLAYDDSPGAQRALAWTSSLQNMFSDEVAVVAVADGKKPPSQWLSEIRTHFSRDGLASYKFIGRQGHPATEVVRAAAETHADLIIAGGYRHTALLEWLVGSTLEKVLRNTQLPVLAA